MDFAEELRESLKETQQNEVENQKIKDENRKKSLELLKDYVVNLVKETAEEVTKEGLRTLSIIPRYHSSGKWGAFSSDIGCFHTTNYRYEQERRIGQEYTGKLDFFVHSNDFKYFCEMIKFELKRCGFNDVKVAFAKYYEKDDNLIFKGKLEYRRLRIKVSW